MKRKKSVAGSLEDLVWDKYDEISQSDLDKNIEREIKGIPYVDKNIDYDNLEDQSEKDQVKRLGLENVPRPSGSGRFQDLGHSFSHPDRTCLFFIHPLDNNNDYIRDRRDKNI